MILDPAKERENSTRAKLSLLLFQLGELFKDPPTVLDYYDWSDNIDYILGEINQLSSTAFNRLEDLVIEAQRRGKQHVDDIDADEAPSVIEHSSYLYFEQVSFITSEINSIKSL
ncbi:MAG: hypothetical protein HYZ47_01150 [Simkania negevensis]|nr:hypothetical protein [Simkania negevensis]